LPETNKMQQSKAKQGLPQISTVTSLQTTKTASRTTTHLDSNVITDDSIEDCSIPQLKRIIWLEFCNLHNTHSNDIPHDVITVNKYSL